MPSKPPVLRMFHQLRQCREKDTRGSAASRGYDAQWRSLRKAHLFCEPLCVFCKRKGIAARGEVVDHIVPHKGSRALLFDPNNLQTLCKSCHDSTKQRMEKGRLRRWNVNGLPMEEG